MATGGNEDRAGDEASDRPVSVAVAGGVERAVGADGACHAEASEGGQNAISSRQRACRRFSSANHGGPGFADLTA